MVNLSAIRSRHRMATEVGKKSFGQDINQIELLILIASCSDVPELLDYIEQLRFEVAEEIETFAAQCLTSAEAVQDQMATCANDHNLGIVEAYRQAANIARVGQSYRNANCTKCRDTRGGLMDHKTEDCTWAPPVGLFEERDQCFGRDMIQVGWVSPDGAWWSGDSTNFVPAEGWKPVYMRKVT